MLYEVITSLLPPRVEGYAREWLDRLGLSGEILGLAGVEGNGQREFIRALGGALPAVGAVEVGARRIEKLTPRSGRAAGIVFLAGDRINEALFPGMFV